MYLEVTLHVLGAPVAYVSNTVFRLRFRRKHVTGVHGAPHNEIRAVQVPADADQHVRIGIGRRPSDPSVTCKIVERA